MALDERAGGDRFGIHRVLDEASCLPQAAKNLDNSLPIFSNEILIQVERLNIDAASFVQMEEETGTDPEKIGGIVLENCKKRGKQQNRVTGSGGMLIGKVGQVGRAYGGPLKASVGDRVSSLVSLTLTPLRLERIKIVHLKTHQIEVEGHAILFESSIAAPLPNDIPENIVMAVYDVAGAPATVNGLCKAGETVVVLGAGGKAGTLSCVAARNVVGSGGQVIAVEPNESACEDLRSLGVCSEVLTLDAANPSVVRAGVEKATHGKMGDVVINVTSSPNTEMSTVLATKKKGKAIFFGMATSFSKVALGAEGVASEASLIVGNGFYPGHAEFAINLFRAHEPLRTLFKQRYSN